MSYLHRIQKKSLTNFNIKGNKEQKENQLNAPKPSNKKKKQTKKSQQPANQLRYRITVNTV